MPAKNTRHLARRFPRFPRRAEAEICPPAALERRYFSGSPGADAKRRRGWTVEGTLLVLNISLLETPGHVGKASRSEERNSGRRNVHDNDDLDDAGSFSPAQRIPDPSVDMHYARPPLSDVVQISRG